MNVDWPLFFGSALMLIFGVTRFIDAPFLEGFGTACGVASLVFLAVSFVRNVRRYKLERREASERREDHS